MQVSPAIIRFAARGHGCRGRVTAGLLRLLQYLDDVGDEDHVHITFSQFF